MAVLLSVGRFSAQDGEVDTSVDAVVGKAGQPGEVVGTRVFDDEDSAGAQYSGVENESRNLGEARQVVGRIGEDEVERRSRGERGEEFEHVAAD